MIELRKTDLLKDERVRREIDQYKWIESEKVGRDIGFDKAAEDWLRLYSQGWAKSRQAEMQVTPRKGRRM